ncbi:MAG TPA: hypothetical protein VJ925_08000 [Longimicrobiales bacterium]|nr:hypothetical protein [Longimicrobiales bacterium]
MIRSVSVFASPLLPLALLFTAAPAEAQLTTDGLVEWFAAVEARNVGPAGMSGRVAAIDVVLSDRTKMFVGAATGGVFRSEDGGLTWDPVFDDQRILGIGDVTVFQGDPDIVWVGTGEGNPRNSAGIGDGLYKSTDGGDTWEFVGFEGSERIHRVLTHPTDPDLVYVGVMGPAWSDGEVRGVYRTTDGGDSWDRVLYVDERTGVGDMAMDPANPDHLIVGMWEFRRWPWIFESGGPGSGMYVTMDGGDSWVERTSADGLPDGELGRMGLAFAASAPNVVYALVEAEESAMLRSTDGGETFETIAAGRGVAPRPFYYADIRVDPRDPDIVYNLHSSMQVSEDQGRNFETVVSSSIIHGDVHDLWIDPDDPREMIMGNDGGIAFSYNRGDTWRFVENLTLAQFYRISLDDDMPYNIYGGLQDNGSWYGPSDVWENKGILNAHWFRVGGGDGFNVYDDPSGDRYGYSTSQGGNLSRFDKITGDRTGIRPRSDSLDLRFNWNAAVAVDPLDPYALYIGSQHVHRSRDRGETWEVISPDLTTNDPAKQIWGESGGLTRDATGAETHTTIIDISPSPIEDGVIWVGTDDGNVQVTRDDGATWTNVAPNIPGVPAGTWVPDVEPSHADAGTAYVVFEDHRRGDWTSYLYRTEDFGNTWERLGEEVDGFGIAIEEDPHEPNLLFLGTELGLWVSVDRGDSWAVWSHVPRVPVDDLEVHARDDDLVLGTHGRGAWVIDDITGVRAVAAAEGALHPEAMGSRVEAIEPGRVGILHPVAEAIGYRSTGMTMWQGETRPRGVFLQWIAGEDATGPARIEVFDAVGRLVATESRPSSPGLNRWVWDLDAGEEEGLAHPDLAPGTEVLPGTYTFRVVVDGEASGAEFEVIDDPRVEPAPIQDRIEANRARSALVRERRGGV